MKSSGVNSGLSIETLANIPTQNTDRSKTRLEKIGIGLADYAMRLASEGHIDENLLARSGLFGHKSFIKRHPEVYDIANGQLAEEGLSVQRTGLSDSEGFATWFENDVMKVQKIAAETEAVQPSDLVSN